MQVGVLIANNGTPTPEQWADVTARQLVDVVRGSKSALLDEALAFQDQVAKIMAQHHRLVIEHEREQLSASHDHMLSRLDPVPFIDDAVEDIIALSRGKSFENHYTRKEVRDFIYQVVGGHFCTAMHVERLHHCDNAKDHPHRHTYKNSYGLQVVDDDEATRDQP